MTTRSRFFLLALLAALLLPGVVLGHADYCRSEPGIGAVVALSPERVEIWFTQEMFRREGENWIRVFGPADEAVHDGEAQIDDDDRSHMSVALLPDLPPGEYRVEWRTLSADDGDDEEGNFIFTLDPQAAVTSTPMREVTPTAPPTPAATAVAAKPGTDSAPANESPASGGCALGLLPAAGLVGLALRRRRRGVV